MVKGCYYTGGDGRVTPCGHNKGGLCRAGAVLTSTSIGAHPADCPLIMKKEGAEHGERSGKK